MPKARTPGASQGSKGSRSSKNPRALAMKRLAQLPQLPELTLVGGRRSLGVYFRENKQTIQPTLAVWLEKENGVVRAFRLIAPNESGDSLEETLEALVEAITKPMFTQQLAMLSSLAGQTPDQGAKLQPFQAGLPAKIEVNDAALAEAVRDMLASIGVSIDVEHREELPEFEEVFQELSAHMGAQEAPPEPFSWEIDDTLLPALYEAAAGYWRRAPWRNLGSDLPLSLKLGEWGPQPGVETLYAVILGNGGEVFGLALYYSLEAFFRAVHRGGELVEQEIEMEPLIQGLRQSGVPVDDIPKPMLLQMLSEMAAESGAPGMKTVVEEGMVVFFDYEEESDPTYLEWMDERKLKRAARDVAPAFFRTREGGELTELDGREVTALTLTLEALNKFFSAQRSQIERLYPPDIIILPPLIGGRIVYTAPVSNPSGRGGKLAVEVSLPAKGF